MIYRNVYIVRMKKITLYVFLSIFTFGLSGCWKHEKEISSEPDYIVGEWKLDKITIFGVEQSLEDCHKQSFMIFESNYEAESKYYTIYASTGNCELHLHYSGTWSYNDGKFFFHVDSSNTSNNPDYNKVLHFLDTEHFWLEETYQGLTGKFYFEKED